MASVEKNGQPSMEEILASIRRIVADDPSGVSPLIDLNRKPMDQSTPSAADGVGADDSPDFELPSMFRAENRSDQPGQVANRRGGKVKSAPIGRLTDAIRSVGPKVAAVGNGGQPIQPQKGPVQSPLNRAVQAMPAKPVAENGDAAFGSRPKSAQSLSSLETSGEAAQERGNGMVTSLRNGIVSPRLATTNGHVAATKKMNVATPCANPVRFDAEPGQSGQTSDNGQPDPVQSTQAQTINPPQETSEQTTGIEQAAKAMPPNPPRVMAAFRDTRMNTMGSGGGVKPADVAASKAVPAEAKPDESDIGSIVPSALDLPGRGHDGGADRANGTGVSASPDYGDVNGVAESSSPVPHDDTPRARNENTQALAADAEANPPPLPDGSDTGAPQQIEDATADLLRPMLRQWLSDNMPRMVEKALHIEVAETVRTGKPTDAS